MTMSQAAIDGITDHGIGWKRQITLGSLPEKVGKIRDGDIETTAEVTEICRNLHHAIGAFAERAPDDIRTALGNCETEILVEDDVDIEDVILVLNNVYDVFDYYRILVR